MGFPDSSECKESTCNAEDLGLIPGLGRSPGAGHDNSLQYSCLENRHGQRSLAGCSVWSQKELEMTEQLSTHACINFNNMCPTIFPLVAQPVKNLPAMWETRVQSLDGEDPLEKGMVTHSSILAWKIP